jgi:hypothetical protein
MGRFVGDLGQALSAALVVIGDWLGLYRGMADCEPLSLDELARPTGTDARHVREWLLIPALDGVQEKLESGALVADVGCGWAARVTNRSSDRWFGWLREVGLER